MKVLLYGRNADQLAEVVKNNGLEIVSESPDVVISYGGDGTLLFSEREYPGIPKLPIRNSQFCIKCSNHQDEKVFKDLVEGQLKLQEYRKLHTNVYGKDLYALNDLVVRNELPTHAIRFKVLTADFLPSEILIGDGIVVSTPFGSTGYFKSITGKPFTDGFALALNNVVGRSADPTYVDQDEYDKEDGFDAMGFELVRGKAVLASDNDPNIFHLSEGTKLSFKLSGKIAKIYEDTSLRCPDCKVKRD